MIIVTCYLAYVDHTRISDEALEAVEITMGGVAYPVDMVSIIGEDSQ